MNATSKWMMTLVLTGFFLAQAEAQGTRTGLRAGFQTSQLTSDVSSLFNQNQKRYYVGLYREKAFLPMLKMGLGLEYYETGSQANTVNLKLGYLSAPIHVKLDLGLFNAYAGVSGAYRLYATEMIAGEKVDAPSGKYNRFDYSTFVGGGVRLLFIGIDLRHHWGRANIYNGFQNRFWQLGGTLYF